MKCISSHSRRIGCAVVSLSLCAALGCSCAVLPAASEPAASSAVDTIPTDANGQPLYDPTVLQDGQLRILYSHGTSGVILCGSKVVCTFSSSENVSLVEDSSTGETNYYFRTWSDSTGRGGRRSALYDKTGTEVRTFDGEWSAALNHNLLVLREDQLLDGQYTGDYSGYGSCQVIDLSSGESLTVPENAYNCFVCGDLLVFNCYVRPADLDADTWDEDHGLHSWVLVQDRDGSTLRRIDAAQSYDLSYYSSGLPEGWVELDTYHADGDGEGSSTVSVLYNPATGEELSGFVQYCGNGTACFQTEDSRYELRDLTAEGCPVLYTFDGQVSYYFSGYAVLWRTDDDFRYELQDLVSGKTYPLYAASATNNDIALYFEDGRLQVFDMTTGELRTDTTVEPVAGQQSILMNCESDGYVWLELQDRDTFDTTATRVYGPEDLVSDLTPLQSTYDYLNYLTTTPEGRPLYCGTYNAPGSSGQLCDVLDETGTVVISGLASCYGYYSNSLNGLPEHVFSAQRGFYYGWMDTTGRWVYCRSIFSSLDDDDQLLW